MPVITCPACQRKARVPAASVGKRVKCPGCDAGFVAELTSSRDPADGPESSSVAEPSDDDARRVTRIGVALLAVSQALIAGATGVRLLLALVWLLFRSAESSFQESLNEFAVVATSMAMLGGIAVAVIGGTFCALPSEALSTRSAAAATVALSVLVAIQGPTAGPRDPLSGLGGARLPGFQSVEFAGLVLIASLTPEVFECARQAMLAVYARSQSRRLGDRAASGLAGPLAFAYPIAVIGLTVLGIAVTLFGGRSHPTFDQVLGVLVLLVKTVLLALGAFVLLRVWLRLRPA
jgi:hypothetical protein